MPDMYRTGAVPTRSGNVLRGLLMAYEKNKSLIAKRFGRCAPQYESVTPVQKQMAEHLVDRVERWFGSGSPPKILELGCGCGRLTRKLVERFPDARVTAIDLAPEMIARAAASISGPAFGVADAETFWETTDQKYDLIISNATVQWFETPKTTLKAYQEMLTDNGLLAVGTFANGTFKELQAAFTAAYKQLGLPAAEHTHKLPGKLFWAEVFPVAYYEEEHITQEFPDDLSHHEGSPGAHPRRQVDDLSNGRGWEAAAAMAPSKKTTLTPQLYRAMVENYEQQFCEPGSNIIPATYHALYILVSR